MSNAVAETPVAVIEGEPALTSLTVAPFWKFEPVMVTLTTVSLAAEAGEIFAMDGTFPEGFWVVSERIPGVITGTIETATWPTLTVYIFSTAVRGLFSVQSLERWPHEPSVFFSITARVYWSVAASYFRMMYRDDDADEEDVAIISPGSYFASGCAGAGVVVSADGDSPEQPANNTPKTRRRENMRKNREFPVIVLF
jgi:hypothetical protein